MSARAEGRLRIGSGRLVLDRAFRLFVGAAGVLVIATLLAILVFVVIEVWPLFEQEKVTMGRLVLLPEGSLEGFVVDEARGHVLTLGGEGGARALALSDGSLAGAWAVAGERRVLGATALPRSRALAARVAGGEILVLALEEQPPRAEREAQGAGRPLLASPRSLVLDGRAEGELIALAPAAPSESGALAVAALVEGGRLLVARELIDPPRGESDAPPRVERRLHAAEDARAPLALGRDGGFVVGAGEGGALLLWEEGDARPRRFGEPGVAAEVSALALLAGEQGLAIGREDGALEIWHFVGQTPRGRRLELVRRLEALPAAVRSLSAAARGRLFAALDERGGAFVYHASTGRRLWRAGEAPLLAREVYLTPEADALFLAGEGRVLELLLDAPHPEISPAALFAPLRYEGYEDERWLWHPRGGSDEHEPKLSLAPLLSGTLKGALFALLFALPLGVLGALYATHFMQPRLRAWIEPPIEIMAALPTVVLGFVAGLWLAPRLEHALGGLLAALLLVPAALLLAAALWRSLASRLPRAMPAGAELAALGIALLAALALSFVLAPPLERALFGGSVTIWLAENLGVAYEQRNALVVGFAMGFAVVPIVFAVAAEAFSSVPARLISGSLALGATRWQTVRQIVLPMSAPGVLSAALIGFGRALGETMIVLMAAGNTAILDWSPLSGLRSLSANIVIEVPEAVAGDTLYRTLFLAGLLLLAITFLVNTLAELVRLRLRRRVAEL